MPMNGAFREAQARVGLLDCYTDFCSLADIEALMSGGLPADLPRSIVKIRARSVLTTLVCSI